MKTEIKITIISHTKDLTFGYWDLENEVFVPVDIASDEMTDILQASPELVEALITTFSMFADAINSDLIDIWKRLDKIEEKS